MRPCRQKECEIQLVCLIKTTWRQRNSKFELPTKHTGRAVGTKRQSNFLSWNKILSKVWVDWDLVHPTKAVHQQHFNNKRQFTKFIRLETLSTCRLNTMICNVLDFHPEEVDSSVETPPKWRALRRSAPPPAFHALVQTVAAPLRQEVECHEVPCTF